MTHPPLPLDDLEAKARAATPGPWRVELCSYDETRVDGIYGPEHHEDYGMGPERADAQIVETDGGYYPPKMNDAAFIAAANPQTVLALVARVRELDAGLGEAVSALGVTFGAMHALYTKPEVCELLVALGAPRNAIDAAVSVLPVFEAKLAALRTLLSK